jgi:hypothetical protein
MQHNYKGQQISQSNNRYCGNDVLEKKQVTVKGFSLSDTKGVWNLEEAKLSEESYDAEYSTETDTLMVVTNFNKEKESILIVKLC